MQVFWLVTALGLGGLAATNPFYRPQVTIEIGIAAWFVDMALVLILSSYPLTARIAIVVAGLFMAVPCWLQGSPLSRFLLMCWMALPFAVATLQVFPNCLGARQVNARARTFDTMSLLHFTIVTVLLAAGIAAVKAIPPSGAWLPVRWFVAGLTILSFAEMTTASHCFLTGLMGRSTPALMRSPHLSLSVGEFWAERWNPVASALLFHRYFFAPLARRGVNLALFAAFFGSALAHVLLLFMATGTWGISLMWGAFFLVQPLIIFSERRMNVRHWSPVAARTWTMSALAITSPLFVEPALQLIQPSWGPPDNVLLPTMSVLIFVLVTNVLFAGLACVQRPRTK